MEYRRYLNDLLPQEDGDLWYSESESNKSSKIGPGGYFYEGYLNVRTFAAKMGIRIPGTRGEKRQASGM